MAFGAWPDAGSTRPRTVASRTACGGGPNDWDGFRVMAMKSLATTRTGRAVSAALLTLAVTFVVATVILNTPIDGGPGVYLNAVQVPAIAPTASSSIYLLMLATAVLALLVSRRVRESRLGTGLFAIHDDEDVAEVMGVPTFRYKLLAFALSCALAGLAGGIHALFVSYVTAGETFNITVPLTVVLMSVLGGTRQWAGPAVGAAAITGLLYFFTAGDHAVAGRAAVGAILVLVILFLPQGILGSLRRRKGAPAQAPAPEAVFAQPVAAPEPAVPRVAGTAVTSGPRPKRQYAPPAMASSSKPKTMKEFRRGTCRSPIALNGGGD